VANPLRSEAAAFRWVLGTIVVAALVVAAAWLSTWAGIAVFLLLVAVGCWRLMSSARRRPPALPPVRADVEDTPDGPPR